jgi:hypothetical protein
MANRRAQHAPEDYNAFGYDPRGRMANAAALLFGENWRPDPVGIPQYNGPQAHGVAPRYGPAAPNQQAHLPPGFTPNLPHNGYLGALQHQRQQGPWAAGRFAQPPPMMVGLQPHLGPYASNPISQRKVQEGPHPEIRPGGRFFLINFTYVCVILSNLSAVYRITASMSMKTIRKEFSLETDIAWADFLSRCCANLDLDPRTAELGYRISGQGPRTVPAAISSVEEFGIAMTRITDIVSRARSTTYGIEVIDLVGFLNYM